MDNSVLTARSKGGIRGINGNGNKYSKKMTKEFEKIKQNLKKKTIVVPLQELQLQSLIKV